MANQLPVRFWSRLACLAVGALLGCRDFVSVNPVGSGLTPAPPEPTQLNYRVKRVTSGGCTGNGLVTTDFAYAKDLFVSQTTQPGNVQELGTPSATYSYDAGGRLTGITAEEKIKRQSGQRALVYAYTYTPTTIVELLADRYADGRQEVGYRYTYALSGGLITGCKEQYYDTGVPVTNQWTYAYTNGNVTRVICKGQLGQIKADYSYEYDDKPNPFYRNATYNWVGSPWAGISYFNFSRNNVVKTSVRSPYNAEVVTVRTFRYTYNQQGLPLTQTDTDGCQTARYAYETY